MNPFPGHAVPIFLVVTFSCEHNFWAFSNFAKSDLFKAIHFVINSSVTKLIMIKLILQKISVHLPGKEFVSLLLVLWFVIGFTRRVVRQKTVFLVLIAFDTC